MPYIRAVRGRRLVLLLILPGVLGSCVAPARTDAAYRAKAADTADAVVSAARTVLLVARQAADDATFAPTAAVAIAEAEVDAASARDAFVSIQPPDASSDAVRRQLLPDVERAVQVIGRVRIAARRAEEDRLPAVASPLGAIAEDLERFAVRYG
jgi:hypothetical protein